MGEGATISAEDVARRSTSIDGLQCAAGELFWVETSESPALARWSPSDSVRLTDIRPGSGLHAYGGGAVAAGPDALWYVDIGDGQIHQRGDRHAVTQDDRVLGALAVAGSRHLLAVGETDSSDDLLLVDVESRRIQTLLSMPFISTPRWRDGLVAWISWGDEVMPWDSSELWVGTLDKQVGVTSRRRIAGGPGISVVEPAWSPAGVLHYLSDVSGWWNLYRWTPASGSVSVAPMPVDCAAAPWEQGYSSYAFLGDGSIAIVAHRGSRHQLLMIDADRGVQQVATPYTMIKPYLASFGDTVALIGASPERAQELALISPGVIGEPIVLRPSSTVADLQSLSLPQELSFTNDGVEIAINYYPAQGSALTATIVRAHSGPTYQSDLRLDNEVQFFTSRGFAVADVDYRGSTGRGRAFRTALNGEWGKLDVRDCAAAALHLIEIGMAKPRRLVIMGASAGGFTALKAVTDPHTPFAGAVARSPIVDPQNWTKVAPRFQRAHAAVLSPAHDAAVDPRVVCRPIAVVHGSADPITPAADAAEFVRAVGEGSHEARLLELDGVGHFPSGGALADALKFEYAACRSFVEMNSGSNVQ